jgi:hypothetical protein
LVDARRLVYIEALASFGASGAPVFSGKGDALVIVTLTLTVRKDVTLAADVLAMITGKTGEHLPDVQWVSSDTVFGFSARATNSIRQGN